VEISLEGWISVAARSEGAHPMPTLAALIVIAIGGMTALIDAGAAHAQGPIRRRRS
jgi:hypothetical protein